MKKYLVGKLLALLAVLILAISPSVPVRHQEVSAIQENQHKAYHWIVTTSADDDTKAGCTAYAVGPHTLLTAEHCMLPHETLYIDQAKDNLIFPSEISAIYYDHQDHVLLDLPHQNFKNYVVYDPTTYQPPTMGERVHFWGSPKGIRDQFRQGYVTGEDDNKESGALDIDAPLYLIAVATVGGDSGSVVFDDADGHIVGIVTYGVNDGMFAGVYPLAFTPNQVNRAEK